MSTITIPDTLLSNFASGEPTKVCDQQGRVLGYFTPAREGTDAEYEWAFREVTKEEIEYSLSSGPCRPAGEVLAELQRRFGT
jgi:hypothetical protein